MTLPKGCPWGHPVRIEEIRNSEGRYLGQYVVVCQTNGYEDCPRLSVPMDSRDAIVEAWNSRQPSFQERVRHWLLACFGEKISNDKVERNHRFLEESLELVQSCGCTISEAHQLVEYVFNRPVGQPEQEVGGVMTTLSALCLSRGINVEESADTELARCWMNIEKIRAKQAAKPKHSPLPE